MLRISLVLASLLCSGAFHVSPSTMMAGRVKASVNNRPLLGLRMSAPAEASKGPVPFTQEMRMKAMSLHTFSQAPKVGEQRDTNANTVVDQWETTREDFLQFLVDNKVVYQAFEDAVAKPHLARFRNTGLERVKSIDEDIAWFKSKYGLSPPASTKPAHEYADFLLKQAEGNVPVFICHFYNYYFAHTAGGRMIGKRVMDSVLGGQSIKFYEWDGDVKDILTQVKTRIDAEAEGWTREQKDASLEATPDTFTKSGLLLRALVGKARDRAARMSNSVTVRDGKIIGVPDSPYKALKKPWDV